MAKHENLTDTHVPYRWSYANTAARTGASGFVSGDIGKLARQLDDDTLWMLTATTPVWAPIGGGSGGHEIQNAGTPMTPRAALNFVGATITDNSGADRTDVTLTAGAGPKACVMFDGTVSPPTILSQTNVASVTRNGTGDYTITFATALANTYYAALIGGRGVGAVFNGMENHDNILRSTTELRIYTLNASFSPANCLIVSVVIF